MSQPSSVKSLDGSSPTSDLQPGLKVALGSMDVELEAELARYRRQAKKSPSFTPTPTTEIPEGKFKVPPPNLTTDSQPHPAMPPTKLASTPSSTSDPTTQSDSTTSSTTSEVVDPSTIPPAQRDSIPNDYLDSSEELLRSTDDDAVKSDASKQNALLTPLGIGSVLLFLLAAAILGYVAFNRSSPENRAASPVAAPTESATGDRVPQSDAPTAAEARKMPSGPNLASEEFVDLDLNSLSSADPSPEPIPSPIPSPTSTPTTGTASPSPSGNVDSLGNLNSVLLPSADPENPDETSAETPTPTSSPSDTPEPSPEASSPDTETVTELPEPIVNDDYYGFYFVLVDAEPEVWQKATEAVPDAYNRTFPMGDRIQMGAFVDRSDAERLVESLNEQNLSAEVYQAE
ncbi:MAG: hypothetical protein WBA24_19095 [Geitlerinemataceae cyanobacterium]